MAGKSNIEWTGFTWNPVAGCTVLTPGCTNCYAMKMAARLAAMGQELYAGLTKPSKAGAVWTGTVRLAPEHVLIAPLKRKKPTTYFVNSMSDLFHEDVADEWIDKVVAVMSMCPQHTFQVLTKRADRMRAYSIDREHVIGHIVAAQDMVSAGLVKGPAEIQIAWPLPNVWLGVSAERQQEADERIPHLLQTPAAIRFVSAEPLLGPIDLTRLCGSTLDALLGHDFEAIGDIRDAGDLSKTQHPPALDWIIVGGESGPDARPFHVEWADSIVVQTHDAGVPCFVKQLGSMPISDGYPLELKSRKGGDPDEWPMRLAIREMPSVLPSGLPAHKNKPAQVQP